MIMKILAFSDWRVQNIEKLIDYVKSLTEKPEVIVYSGDDIIRFNKIPMRDIPEKFKGDAYRLNFFEGQDKNYFEGLAKLSKFGLVAVAGNDDFKFVSKAICGNKVFNVHESPFIIENYAFIGLEGATTLPGFLLHSEQEVEQHLSKMYKKVRGKKIIVVSHMPPHEILDFGIRFSNNNIGSRSLKKFVESNKDVALVICGHAHSQGGKEQSHKGIKVINCASHDREGDPGKLAHIVFNEKGIDVEWTLIRDEDEIMAVPLVGSGRAKVLKEFGINTIEQLAEIDLNDIRISEHQHLRRIIPLIKDYARAIIEDEPIIVGKHSFFENLNNKNIFFFDAEYNPEGTKNGPFGIFLIGIMDTKGNVKQRFLEKIKDEKRILEEFNNWLTQVKPILIAYSSMSADKPQLLNAFKRFNIPTIYLEGSFFDLYYDCINTQRQNDQVIFLPMRGSMSVKEISTYFGYDEPKDLQITDGLQALGEYEQFLKTRNKKIKEELLKYNKVDLERTKFVFDRINKLMN